MNNFIILHVEDNEGDVLLTKEAFENFDGIKKIDAVSDGTEAIDYLLKKGIYSNKDLPDIVLLDINLPKKNGFEVLEVIKTNEVLKHIPVIMFTTSSSQRDVKLSYQKYANCFISKPSELSDFFEVFKTLEQFWTKTVTLSV